MHVDPDFEILSLSLCHSKNKKDKTVLKSGICILNEEIKKDKGLTNVHYFQFKLLSVSDLNPQMNIGVCTNEFKTSQFEQLSR